MFGQPPLELGIALEDELQSLTDYVIELVRPEELGIARASLGKGFVNAQVQPASRELWFRRLKRWHGCRPLHLRSKPIEPSKAHHHGRARPSKPHRGFDKMGSRPAMMMFLPRR